VATAALWIAGGVLFRILEEGDAGTAPDGGWPGVTVLIPAYNERLVIATSVGAALAADYPVLEVLVLDDGSTDATETAALQAAAGDPRCLVVRDPVNRGKAERSTPASRAPATTSWWSPTPTRTCIRTRSSSWSRGWPPRRCTRRSPVRRT
jgi:biofilm PGA synthesis N-glycosyltransferase PgaC